MHEVHYAMVVVLAMGIGLFAPPFWVGYYAACAISRIHPDEGMKPILGYMLALLIGTIVVAAVPWISIVFLLRRSENDIMSNINGDPTGVQLVIVGAGATGFDPCQSAE